MQNWVDLPIKQREMPLSVTQALIKNKRKYPALKMAIRDV